MKDKKFAQDLEGLLQNHLDEMEWIIVDLNEDGINELILREKRYLYTYMLSIVCNLWDTGDAGEFYFLHNNHLMYYTGFYGAIGIVLFQEY